MAEIKEFLEFVFNPVTATPFLLGLFAGGLGGFKFAIFSNNRLAKLSEAEIERLKVEVQKTANECEQVKQEFEHAKHNWEYEKSDYQARNEALQQKVKTIRCGICGESMNRMQQYRNGQFVGSPMYVDLQCTGANCGQVMPFNLEEIKAFTKTANK